MKASYIAREEKKPWICPACKSRVINGLHLRFQSFGHQAGSDGHAGLSFLSTGIAQVGITAVTRLPNPASGSATDEHSIKLRVPASRWSGSIDVLAADAYASYEEIVVRVQGHISPLRGKPR